MRVEILAVGDELLLGSVVNSNAARLGQWLTEAGCQVTRATVVGDDVTAISAALREALRRADAVVITGGLGPTADDRTREALAAVAGVPLARDASAEKELRAWYERHHQDVPGFALRQADLPAGAAPLPNPVGSAPGIRLLVDGVRVYALPGVPAEADAMFTAHVLPELRAGNPPAVRTLRTALLPEPLVAARLAPLEAEVPIGYLPQAGEVHVRLTAPSEERLLAVEARARELLGDVVYGTDADSLDVVVHRLLAARGATVATAESLTGGLTAGTLTDMPGASSTFRGAVVAYATELKAGLLGVDRTLLDQSGAVHPEVARQMAVGVRDRLGTTYGIATTGVAGPDPQDGQPVGTVYIAVAGPAGTRVAAPRTGTDRATIRRVTVVAALDLLRRVLLDLPSAEGEETW